MRCLCSKYLTSLLHHVYVIRLVWTWFLHAKISIPIHLYRGLYGRPSPFLHDCTLRCALRQSHLKSVMLRTDSQTVYGWLQQLLNNIRRLCTGDLQEVLVRQRVQIISNIVVTVGLQLKLRWVAPAENITDTLTRIPAV